MSVEKPQFEEDGSGLTQNRTLNFLLVIAGLVIIVVVAWVVWNRSSGSSRRDLSPSTVALDIAGIRAERVVTGEPALSELTKMHGKDTGLTSGYITYYRGGAIAWVGKVADDPSAALLTEAMTSKIKAGNPYFGGLQELSIDGVTVYAVNSRDNLKHYYFRTDNAVIWLAIPPADADRFLSQAVRLLP